MAKIKIPAFLDTKTVPGLLGKVLLIMALPYVYLMLCGLVFDFWLKWYFMTNFIFYSLLVLYLAAFALSVWLVVRFVRAKGKEA